MRIEAGVPDGQPAAEAAGDFIDHIDDWIEYLVALLDIARDEASQRKYERQLKYLLRFRCGANANVAHNHLLWHYYGTATRQEALCPAVPETDAQDLNGRHRADDGTPRITSLDLGDTIAALRQSTSMAVHTGEPVQACYRTDRHAFTQIAKALAAEDLFLLQGPPGTGKTTAIVEVVLQTLAHKPDARILITSETHVAVDNALDRLTALLDAAQLDSVLRYPAFSVETLDHPPAYAAEAHARANARWQHAMRAAPELTAALWEQLPRGKRADDGSERLPRWIVRNLADQHRIIGVTCNQIEHLLDEDSEMFDLVIVDECSKATLPEWLMAMSVGRKCLLVGDHKQLPPTFCEDESEALATLSEHKEKLIRDGVIERLFANLPDDRKGTLIKQYRMLPSIGSFVSDYFYGGRLQHHRTGGNGPFEDFGWLTYRLPNYKIPPQRPGQEKVLVNPVEIQIIVDRLRVMRSTLQTETPAATPLSVAVITPYRAQCRELRRTLSELDLKDTFSIDVDTVDAFQGRQADIVFFSFVRTVGPATFFADDRRLNVAISRARDCVYLVGDLRYIRSKRIPALQALATLKVLHQR